MTREIVLVEDDEPVRDSLGAVLESWDYEVTAFEDGESLLAHGIPAGTCCVLLDVRLPGIDGISLISEIRKTDTHTPIIMLTGHGDVPMAVKAMHEGAQDFIEKPYDDQDLIQRIDIARSEAKSADEDQKRIMDRFASLTPRESDVMREVVAGHANKTVAHHLGLSPKTVEIHRARVMEKTGARSLSQLVRMALKIGIDPDVGQA